jgi:hypothetical protein
MIEQNDDLITRLTPRRRELAAELSTIECKICPAVLANIDLKRELFMREKGITKVKAKGERRTRQTKVKKTTESMSGLVDQIKNLSKFEIANLVSKLEKL